jgi:WD40 repeat protein
MNTCPSSRQLRLLLIAEPNDPELLSAEAHVEACPACHATLESITVAEMGEVAPLARIGVPRPQPADGTDFLRTLKTTPPPEFKSAIDTMGGPPSAPSPSQPPASPAAADLPRVPGYLLVAELGRGGMGVVYKARQVTLNRPVALKMILAGAHASDIDRKRFRREAEAVARLQHPHIVQIHEVGEHEGQPYLALELVDGGCLAQQLRNKPRPARQSAELVETLARAVHVAHECGIVHRDLKPANILLTASGTPKVADFGLAKRLDAGPAGPTSSGQFLGTPSYMAPEQAIAAGASHRGCSATGLEPAADVYSLGAILYEMLTGRPPFRAESSVETLLQVLHDDPVPPSRLQPKLPRDLETICLTCLRKDPARRYSDARAMAEDLRRYLAGEPVLARPTSARERLWKWVRRRPAAAALVVTGVLAVAAGFAGISMLWRMAEVRALLEATAHREAAARTELERTAKEAEASALHRAERQNADLVVDHAWTLCQRGEVPEGMLRMAAALGRLPAGAGDLDRVIRTNLAAWCYRLVSLRLRLVHTGRVLALAYGPDGRVVLTGGDDQTARLWDVATGDPLTPPLHHEGAVRCVAFRSDGRAVLTGSDDKTARLWDVATGEPAGPPLVHESAVRIVAFRPDGVVALTGGEDGTAQLWDAASGRRVGQPMRHAAELFAAAFEPNGQSILTGAGDKTARLWDAATGTPIGTPWPHDDAVQAVAFSPDGQHAVTACRDGTASLWSPAFGHAGRILLRHPYPVCTVAFSPDGRALLTGSGDERRGEARLWDTKSGGPIGAVMPHNGRVECVAWSPNGRHVLTGGQDSRASLWLEVADRPVRKLFRQGGAVHALAFGPNGRTLAIASYDSPWPQARGEAWLHFTPPEQQAGPTLPHPSWVTAVAFSSDGRAVVIGGTGRTACLWDTATGRPIGGPLATTHTIDAAAFSPDGRMLAAGATDGLVHLWDTATGRPIGQPLVHPGAVRGIAFNHDGKFLAVAVRFRTAWLWDVTRDHPQAVSWASENLVLDVAFSPDGNTLLTGGGDNTAQLWHAATRRPLGQPLRHVRQVESVAFGHDGRTVLTGSGDMTARLWDAATGRLIVAPLLHPDVVTKVAYSPDGRTLATVCADDLTRLWDASTGKPIGAPLPQTVSAIAFHPDGRVLLTGGREGTAKSWTVPRPLTGDAEQVLLWTKIVTGAELDANGVQHRLDAAAVRELRRSWERLGAQPPL